MKIAMVASEAAPFVKTGGLGDVLQALPQALSEIKNNEVSVFIPFYDRIKYSGKYDVEFLGYFDVPLAWRREYVGLLRLKISAGGVAVPVVEFMGGDSLPRLT